MDSDDEGKGIGSVRSLLSRINAEREGPRLFNDVKNRIGKREWQRWMDAVNMTRE